MVFAPSGYFLMGSQTGMPNEQPEHPVLLDGFFIDKFEVTNADYRQCVAAGGCTPQNKKDAFTYPGYSDAAAFDNYPVISVNWDQAKTYCSFAGKRLPTEAEWEYAASGPDNLVYPWGNSFSANLSAATAPDTQAAGSFPGGASPFGAMDMAGNVGEWVADAFDQNFYANSPASNPVASGGDERIFRGGSFANPDGQFYTTSRRYTKPRTFSDVDIGLRCALNAPGVAASPALKDEFCTEVYSVFNPEGTCP
jgi:formylglycine-generating enzyme required for sulfatase activity